MRLTYAGNTKVTSIVKRMISLILIFFVFVFICDSDRAEQGRFVQSVQNVIEDNAVSLSVVSAPKPNTDALTESRGDRTNISEFRITGRQAKKAAKSYDTIIFLLLIVLIIMTKDRFLLSSAPVPISSHTTILTYILRQDGKK